MAKFFVKMNLPREHFPVVAVVAVAAAVADVLVKAEVWEQQAARTISC